MKKTITVLLFLLFVFLCTLIGSEAEEAERESLLPTVTSGDGELILTADFGEGREAIGCASLSEALAVLGQFPEIRLDSVTLGKSEELPEGSYTLLGSLRLSGGVTLTVPESCSLAIVSGAITLEESAYLRVKGGSLELLGTSISAHSTAIVTDYSHKASVLIKGGGISSRDGSPTLLHRYGRMILSSVSIENTRGTALRSDSTLELLGVTRLSGVGADIELSRPVLLSDSEEAFSPTETLTARYLGSFERGIATPLFFGAEPRHREQIELIDSSGAGYPMRYFESPAFTDEKRILAVYLPYTLTLVTEEGREELELLSGEIPEARIPPLRVGYSFSGWYTDPECLHSYSFGSPVTSDLEIYAGYTLLPPEFSLGGIRTVYDGAERILRFSSLSHPLLSDGGIYLYKWYKNGVEISRSSELSLSTVSDSGLYSCEVTFVYSSDSITVFSGEVEVLIEKRALIPPMPSPVFYDGAPKLSGLFNTATYTVDELAHTEAGVYPVTLTLTDPDNYRWSSSDGREISVMLEILPAENSWIDEFSVFDTYIGAEIKYSGKPRFGNVKLLYSEREDGVYSESAPTAVGSYFAKAFVEGSESYSAIESAPVAFRILGEYAVSMTPERDADRLDYTAFERFVPTGLSMLVTYNSGRSESVSGELLGVSYQHGTAFSARDNGVILSYGGIRVSYPVRVTAAEYDLSGLDFRDTVLTYSGRMQSIKTPVFRIVGRDGIALGYTVSGGGVNVGEYSVTLTFRSESPDYLIPESISAKLTIIPFVTEITWQNTEFIYDGKPKAPVALYTDVYGATQQAIVTGAKTDAGEGYIASALPPSENYSFTSSDAVFKIGRAVLSLDGVIWSADSFVYDGSEKRVTLSGLPEGVSVIGYTSDRATEAGVYTVGATLLFDSRNYDAPTRLTHSFEILPAEYPTDGFSFGSVEVVYDGRAHYPTLLGEMPVGADGIALSYSFLGSATQVSEGCVAVTVLFSTESKNYKAPDPLTLYVTVTPKPIEIEWSYPGAVYDGKPHSPSATSPYTDIILSEPPIDAGSYVATASPLSSDFRITNPTYPFVISRAENKWLSPPRADSIFAGDSLSASATPLDGSAVFRVYTDQSLSELADLSVPGIYYLVAEVEGSKNYEPLVSYPVSFEVVMVVAVRLEGSVIRSGLVAFERLSGSDLSITVIYNNGSRESLDPELAAITYEHSDSLRRADSHITVSAIGLELILPVEVGYASYDLSGVRFVDTKHTYDSLPKTPTLIGLPSGVRVIEYIGGAAIDAGVYTVSALLDYDSENYLEPKAPVCRLEISPATVSIPSPEPVVYNGREQSPSSKSPLFTYSHIAAKNAGEYTVTVSLTDPKNYIFENGSVSTSVTFLITPRRLTLATPDLEVYLWQSVGESEYSLTGGEIASGDSVGFIRHITDGRVLYISDNPNYEVITEGGRITRLDRLSPETSSLLFILTLLLLVLILMASILFAMRERILDHLAALRSRRAIAKARREELERGAESREPLSREPEQSDTGAAEADEAELGGASGEPSEPDRQDESDSSEPEQDSDRDPSEADAEGDETLGKADDRAPSDEPECEVDPVDTERADELITDELARDLLYEEGRIRTSGKSRGIINVDTLSESFDSGDRVDVNILKQKSLVPYDTAYIKVLARGIIDKPLSVYANDFSLCAVKMIALTGGRAVKVTTELETGRKKN